jgi:peroxiredoxin
MSKSESQSAKADTLCARLAAYTEEGRREYPDLYRAYDRLVALLATIDQNDIGPAIGDLMPEFLLPDQDGRFVALGSLLEDGPVVVSFNRGHWCPYCELDLRALARIHGDIERLGASFVSITPETAQFNRLSIAENELPFSVLSDVDLSYSLSLGMIHWIGADTIALYDEIGIELERYQGNGNCFLPIAAKFIIGTDGLVKARHIDTEFRQRMEPTAILAALESLRAV